MSPKHEPPMIPPGLSEAELEAFLAGKLPELDRENFPMGKPRGTGFGVTRGPADDDTYAHGDLGGYLLEDGADLDAAESRRYDAFEKPDPPAEG